jgi:Glycerate kinase
MKIVIAMDSFKGCLTSVEANGGEAFRIAFRFYICYNFPNNSGSGRIMEKGV